jgi:hypothetical protein
MVRIRNKKIRQAEQAVEEARERAERGEAPRSTSRRASGGTVLSMMNRNSEILRQGGAVRGH